MAKSFDQLVKEHGSVSAAMQATGHSKNDKGQWSSSGNKNNSSKPSSGGSRPADGPGYHFDFSKNPSGGWTDAEMSEGFVNARPSGGSSSRDDAPRPQQGVTNNYNGFDYTQRPGEGIYGVPTINSDIKRYEQNGVWYQAGADMSRRPELAGKVAISNGYTVFYDRNGYATKAVKGVADYTPHLDPHVGAGGKYGASGSWTDQEMLSANDRNAINKIRQQMQAGLISGDEANRRANAIRAGYGYTIDKNGYVTDSGALSAVNDRRKKYGLGVSPESGETVYYRYLMGTDTSPMAQASGSVKPYEQFVQEGGLSVQAPSMQFPSVQTPDLELGFGVGSSAEAYLRDLWEQKIAADLAALQSAYEQNMADIKAQDDLISQQYSAQRNQLAAQNDLQRMQMNELGLMQGLNTGTTGQMALANSAALQSGLAALGGQEAQSLADNALNAVKLSAQYRNEAARAEAAGQAQLAEALYEEAKRQQELALEAQRLAQQQANWEKQFAYQQQMDDRDLVGSMLGAGIPVNGAMLESAGIDPGLLQLFQQAAGIPAGGATSAGSSGGAKPAYRGYDNGGLTSDQVRQLQRLYGVAADGLWGKNSAAAAGGLSAKDAWQKYTAPISGAESLSPAAQSLANGLARSYLSGTQQRDAIIEAYEAGRITQGEARFLAKAVGANI